MLEYLGGSVDALRELTVHRLYESVLERQCSVPRMNAPMMMTKQLMAKQAVDVRDTK